MCAFFSAIVTKNKVFYDIMTDSHEKLIDLCGLDDNTASPDFVRVTLLPRNGDIFNTNIKNWEFYSDQDIFPAWYDEDKARGLTTNAFYQARYDCLFLNGDDDIAVFGKKRIFVKNCKGRISCTDIVNIYGDSSVLTNSCSIVNAYDTSEVLAFGSGIVHAKERSTVTALEYITAFCYDISMLNAKGYSHGILTQGATCNAFENSHITIPMFNSRNVSIGKVEDNATVHDARHNMLITKMDSIKKTS